MGLLVAAGALVSAAPAFAGFNSSRLNGSFGFEDEGTGDDNEVCLHANFDEYELFGEVLGTSGACTVSIFYDAFAANKISASVLKSDDSGSVKISQQVETYIEVSISGAECATPLPDVFAFPEKCKVSGSVNATEGVPDTVEKGKVSLNCDLTSVSPESGSTFDDITDAQSATILDAFAGRKDVRITDQGKLTIRTKGVPDPTGVCSIL
jgi:hypothetical protein